MPCGLCLSAVCAVGNMKLSVTLFCPLSAASRDCDSTDTDDLLLKKKEKLKQLKIVQQFASDEDLSIILQCLCFFFSFSPLARRSCFCCYLFADELKKFLNEKWGKVGQRPKSKWFHTDPGSLVQIQINSALFLPWERYICFHYIKSLGLQLSQVSFHRFCIFEKDF